MIPGEIIIKDEDIILNDKKETVVINVASTGDRPIQVGSHFHFFETNKALEFDRAKSYGMRLDIPSGTAVRFEPGEEKEIQLVAIGGSREIFGLNDLTAGLISSSNKKLSMDKARASDFKGVK